MSAVCVAEAEEETINRVYPIPPNKTAQYRGIATIQTNWFYRFCYGFTTSPLLCLLLFLRSIVVMEATAMNVRLHWAVVPRTSWT